MVSVDYVIQGVKSRAKFIDMSPGAQRLLLSEIDRFFNTHLCRVLPTGSYNWLVEVHHPEWKSYGTISEGAYQAIIEECIERVASREWKKVSDRLLLRNNSAVGVASVLDHEQEHDDDIEQQQHEQQHEHERAINLAATLGYALPKSPLSRLLFVDYARFPVQESKDAERKRLAALASAIKSADSSLFGECAVQ